MGQEKEYMDLAWEVARKLTNFSDKQREDIFGYSDIGKIISNNSVNVTNGKIMEYEKKLKEEEINVGDIVKWNNIYKGVVTCIGYNEEYEESFSVVFADGELNTYSRDELTKTGKSIDILNSLRKLILG